MKRSIGGPEGFVIIDKPAGRTSHDIVGDVRRALGERRVGHGGTLDPDATGVLVVAVGQATRLLRFVSELDKTYTGEVVLGTATSTLDASGEVTGSSDMSGITVDDVRRAAQTLTGEIEQIPPMVSAIKVGGKRLYELAREGQEIERAARPVTVSRFEIAPGPTADSVAIEVDCSSGTYIRSLADDLGRALGGHAHLRNLVRTRIGTFPLVEAVAPADVTVGDLRLAIDLVGHLDRVAVGDETAVMVRHGRVLPRDILGVEGGGPWAVTSSGEFLAIYESHGARNTKPTLVCVPSAAPDGAVSGEGRSLDTLKSMGDEQ